MSQTTTLRLSEALEEYLEAIYTLSAQNKSVRITDIALKLGFSKPSVNRAVNLLKNAGFVSHKPYCDIELTQSGMLYGDRVYGRHSQIKKFLINVLNINPDDAEKEAVLIEHGISQNTVDSMVTYMEASAAV